MAVKKATKAKVKATKAAKPVAPKGDKSTYVNHSVWIAPSEKGDATNALEKRLWDAADQFRANSGLKAQEYSSPILGLIFLRFAEVRFASQFKKLEQESSSTRRGSRVDDPTAYHANNVLYLSPEARFGYLLKLPESADIGGKVNAAMREVENHNSQLAGVLPKTFNIFTSSAVAICATSWLTIFS